MPHQLWVASRARVLGLLILCLISACAGGATPTTPTVTGATQSSPASPVASAKPLPLTVSNFTGTLVNILDEVALRQGFFKQNGLDVQLVPVRSTTAIFAAVGSGGMDIGSMGIGPLLQAMERDPSVKYQMVAGHGQSRTNTLTVNSTIPTTTEPFPQKLRVLKGKAIGCAALGTPGCIEIGVWIKLAGMSPNDVTFVGVGGPDTARAALEKNDVQAILIGDPLSTTLALEGKGFHNLVDMRQGTEGTPSLLNATSGMSALRSWADAHPKEVAAYQKSIAQAHVWMNRPENFTTLVGIESELFGGQVAEPAMSEIARRTLGNNVAFVDPKFIGATADFYLENGLLKQRPDTTGFVHPNCPATEADVAKLAGQP